MSTLGIWWHERARALKVEGKSYREIAALFGVTNSAVWKVCNPERALEMSRRENARPGRREEKRRWERENYRGVCEVCGAETSRRGYTHCKLHFEQREQARAKRREIVERWAAGETMRQICAAMGMTRGHLSAEIGRMRAGGWNLPHRYAMVHGKRVAA